MSQARTGAELQALASALSALPVVRGVDVLHGGASPTLQVTLITDLHRVPPAVHRVLARHDAGTGPQMQQGDHWVLEVRA